MRLFLVTASVYAASGAWHKAPLAHVMPWSSCSTPYLSVAIKWLLTKAFPIIRASQEFKLRLHSFIPPTNRNVCRGPRCQQVCMRARRVLKAVTMHPRRMPG
jgi:hypothetical protein